MFRWGIEKEAMVTDLACIEDLTIQDIANRVGASLSSVKKFYRSHRDQIETARSSMLVSDRILSKVLDLWGDGLQNDDIAVAVGLPVDTVRRLVLCAQYDEEAPREADYELAALQSAHPGRMYMDDVRALIDLPLTRFEADAARPFSQDIPHRMALAAPSARRPVTLAAAA